MRRLNGRTQSAAAAANRIVLNRSGWLTHGHRRPDWGSPRILTATHVIGGGGGGADREATTQDLTTWATSANAICARANDTTNALPDPHALAPRDIASYLKTAVALERRMLRQLNDLPVPSNKRTEAAMLLSVGAKMSDATSELANDVTLGNLAAAQGRARLLSRLNTRFNNAAINLGARTCAEGSSLGDIFGG
jgi:hypothetical protein